MKPCGHSQERLRWVGSLKRDVRSGHDHQLLWCLDCGSIARSDGGPVLILPEPSHPSWPRSLQRPGSSAWMAPDAERLSWCNPEARLGRVRVLKRLERLTWLSRDADAHRQEKQLWQLVLQAVAAREPLAAWALRSLRIQINRRFA